MQQMDPKFVELIKQNISSQVQKSRVVPFPGVGEVGVLLPTQLFRDPGRRGFCLFSMCLQDGSGPHLSSQQDEEKNLEQLVRGFIGQALNSIHLPWLNFSHMAFFGHVWEAGRQHLEQYPGKRGKWILVDRQQSLLHSLIYSFIQYVLGATCLLGIGLGTVLLVHLPIGLLTVHQRKRLI